MKKLNWDDFRIFLSVARTESALDATRSLGLDQSTISRRLYRLEKDMGAKLFDRGPQGHKLTTAGHRLLDHVEKMESTFAAVEADVSGDSVDLTGEIRLGATEAFGSYFLAPHIAHFCAQHPAITVDLLPLPRNINLSKREADASVTIERPSVESFVVSRLSDYRLLPYATPEYLRSRHPIKEFDDFLRHRWIDYVDDLIFTDQQFSLKQWLPNVKPFFRSTSVVAQFHAVRSGLGIAVLPCFLGNTAPDLVPVLPAKVDITRTFWMVAPKERRELARVRALWDYLRKVALLNEGFLMGYSKQPAFDPSRFGYKDRANRDR